MKREFRGRLAPSVAGRVDFHRTDYSAWITWDGVQILNMTHDWGYGKEGERASIFSKWQLGDAMFRYLNNPIEDILRHERGLIRALGMLDRRLGKRRLQEMDVSERNCPPIECLLYILRCEAEGIAIAEELASELPALRDSLAPIRMRFKIWERPSEQEIEQAEARLSQTKGDNLRNLIREPLLVSRDDLTTDLGRTIYDVLNSSQQRSLVQRMLAHVARVGCLLDDDKFGAAVVALAEFADRWIRPADAWKPATKNRNRQFTSLARHLLAKYDVPSFMDAAWFGEMPHARDWYCWIGGGNNIRKAANLPIKLTKAMAHHFVQAPIEYTIGAAFRWGQIRSLGGEPGLCNAVAKTRLSRDVHDDVFWLSVFRFFVDNPMLDRRHVSPIVDYIWNRRFEPRVDFVERGVAVQREPLQPNFSMQGRTVDALLRDVAIWHGELAKNGVRPKLMWRKSAVPDFECVELAENRRSAWTIKELLSTDELIKEGRWMQHCVASYDRSCAQGNCSIWSMQRHFEDSNEPRLTIETDCLTGEIRQARGFLNRLPNQEEIGVLDRWRESLARTRG